MPRYSLVCGYFFKWCNNILVIRSNHLDYNCICHAVIVLKIFLNVIHAKNMQLVQSSNCLEYKFLFCWIGSGDQIRYIVSQGCIPPLCDLLTVMDAKIVQVTHPIDEFPVVKRSILLFTVGARIPNTFGFRLVEGVQFMVPTIQKLNFKMAALA